MKRTMLLAASALVFFLLTACGSDGGDGAPTSLDLSFTRIASGLSAPTAITHAGDGSDRLFFAEQGGRIRILSAGTLDPDAFLDLTDRLVDGGEQGLLGLAFPPGTGAKAHFYVYYTRAEDGAGVLSRFAVTANPDVADPSSEEVLLTVPQPFANHNGGHLAFGPRDGYLYLGLGDGGGSGDPGDNAQDPATLPGSLLRLDVENGADGYDIPADNPFVGNAAGADEVWAYGLRNPWRFSFDRLTGDLYIGDVGQATWEEIDWRSADAAGGANFGWNLLEGDACFEPASGCVPPPAYVAPATTYEHTLGNSVTGGYVYRGPGNPAMEGVYFYGDFGSGRIWALRRSSGTNFLSEMLTDTDFAISTFGEDEAGRLYLADYRAGDIYRIDQP